MKLITKTLLVSLLTLSLTSCSLIGNLINPSDNVSSSDTTNSSENSINSETSNSDSTNLNEKIGISGKEFFDYKKDGYASTLPSKGSPDVLVVPIMFKGESLANSDKVLNDINLAFNGTSEDCYFESVDSFYQKSSYQQLDIDFTVYNNWITLDKTLDQMISWSSFNGINSDPSWYAVDYVTKYLRRSGYNMKDYDSNNDGYIDGLWLVYGKKYGSGTDDVQNDVLWAYTYWKENEPNKNIPTANVYCWASYYFMYEGNYAKPDAHTFIHETGHILGLDDYYDYDQIYSPAGKLDMMDANIGDHNAYSKYLYGWIDPIYIKEEQTVTIRPFESSGDAIVVPYNPNGYKGPFEEYLIIEYYTPTGLNFTDSNATYRPNGERMFTHNGIKIYHVDSRLGKITNGDKTKPESNLTKEYIDIHSNNRTYYDIMTSNTGSYSYNNNEKLLTLLSSVSKNSHNYYEYRSANNHDLFKKNDRLVSYKAHQGIIPFNLKVDDITNDGATITFYK